jgi:hypothetical protein
MDRLVLLALLAVPILVVIHVALVWQPVRAHEVMFGTASQDARLQGRWQSPTRFVVNHTAARGL